MKRALFLVPLVLIAALAAVNWKLDHPAFTKADAAFARLVAGADEVELSTFSDTQKTSVRGTQLSHLRSCLRFEDVTGFATQGYDSYYTLVWKNSGSIGYGLRRAPALFVGKRRCSCGFQLPFEPALWQTISERHR